MILEAPLPDPTPLDLRGFDNLLLHDWRVGRLVTREESPVFIFSLRPCA